MTLPAVAQMEWGHSTRRGLAGRGQRVHAGGLGLEAGFQIVGHMRRAGSQGLKSSLDLQQSRYGQGFLFFRVSHVRGPSDHASQF